MIPRVALLRTGLLHAGISERVDEHATPTYKLVIALDAPFELRVGARVAAARVALVPPHVEHSLETRGPTFGLFMSPGSRLAPFAPGADVRVLHGAERQRLLALARAHADALGDESMLLEEAFTCLALQGRRIDARVSAALARIACTPDEPVRALAARLRLSPERLRHLIVQETGCPLRVLRRFERTMLAVERVLAGEPLPSAAHGAGFADQAHFTRSFARAFGRRPSEIPRHAARIAASWTSRG